MTLVVAASPTPILQFFSDDGTFLVGGQLFTSVGGVPYPTYADPLGLVQHANPIILNNRGEIATSSGQSAQLYLIPNVTYTFALFDAQSNPIDTPTNMQGILTLPIILQSLTQQVIGGILMPQTETEEEANVTPINLQYPPLTVDRYGSNDFPGSTSMATAFQSAINVAKKQGGVVTWGVGPYLIDSELDLTNPVGSQNCMFALIGQGRFKAPTNTPGQNATPSIILKHTGHAFDTTGSLGVHFENMSICTDETVYPKTCFLLARNSDGNSRSDRVINCYVLGRFSKTVLYNYGAEDGVYFGNEFWNISADSDTTTFEITGFNNIRNLTSTFTTIATGQQSTLDHKIYGGVYANLFQGSGATSDVFRFDGARSIKIDAIWIDCSSKNGLSSGRSLFYLDGTNAATQGLYLHGIDGEAALNPANYGILVSNHVQTHVNIVIEGNWFPNALQILAGGANSTISTLTWINTTNAGQGGGIVFGGAFLSSSFDASSGTVVAASFDNFTNCFNGSAVLQANGQVGLNLRDFSQASGSQWVKLRYNGAHVNIARCDDTGAVVSTLLDISPTGFGFNNTAAVAKPTVTGSRGSNAALASLLAALASMGLITDGSS